MGTVSSGHMGAGAVSLPSPESSSFSLQSLHHCHPLTLHYFLPVHQHLCWPTHFIVCPNPREEKKPGTGCIKEHLLCTTLCLLFYASLNTSAVFTANRCLLVLFPLAKTSIFPASVALQEKPHIHTFLAFSTGEQNWFPGIRMTSSKENICCQLRFDL